MASEAVPRAIDMGIAMQITNICRDVAEDARLGRVYLPADRLAATGVSQEAMVAAARGEGSVDPEKVFSVVRDLLHLAERYYASADLGIKAIPGRARLAILVAARLYRAIGLKTLRRGPIATTDRTIVGPVAKVGWVASAGASYFGSVLASGSKALEPHPVELHVALKGLPGVSA